MARFVALLRGINVGGNNIIPMAKLRGAFEAMGHGEVATLIASGNVIFTAKATSEAKLTAAIEAALAKAFDYDAKVVVLSAANVARVIDEAPPKFGADPKRYRYDVLFVKPPMRARAALPDIPTKDGVDEVTAGAHALYFRRVLAKATQSKLAKVVGMPIYKHLTIRSWNTTTKLAALAAKA